MPGCLLHRLNQPSHFGWQQQSSHSSTELLQTQNLLSIFTSLAAQLTAAMEKTFPVLWPVCPPRAHAFPCLGWWGKAPRRARVSLVKNCATVGHLCSICAGRTLHPGPSGMYMAGWIALAGTDIPTCSGSHTDLPSQQRHPSHCGQGACPTEWVGKHPDSTLLPESLQKGAAGSSSHSNLVPTSLFFMEKGEGTKGSSSALC